MWYSMHVALHGYIFLSIPFYSHGLALIPALISNHMSSKAWDEVTYALLKFGNG